MVAQKVVERELLVRVEKSREVVERPHELHPFKSVTVAQRLGVDGPGQGIVPAGFGIAVRGLVLYGDVLVGEGTLLAFDRLHEVELCRGDALVQKRLQASLRRVPFRQRVAADAEELHLGVVDVAERYDSARGKIVRDKREMRTHHLVYRLLVFRRRRTVRVQCHVQLRHRFVVQVASAWLVPTLSLVSCAGQAMRLKIVAKFIALSLATLRRSQRFKNPVREKTLPGASPQAGADAN